ncbi:MAG: matrixin [Gammaproteobacteria bacterium]|nr:matrixin [Gammaproteobacteria bacterium]
MLDYSFIDSAGDFSYTPGNPFSSAFSATQEAAAELALSYFAGVIDVTFNELGDDGGEDNADGTLRFANHTGGGTYYPDASETGGDMAFQEGSYATAPLGSYEFHTFLHLVGHTMGLKHGHTTTSSGGVVSGSLTADKDSMEYSVMTFNSYVGTGLPGFYTNATGHYAQSLMMYDIAALQRLYGANTSENSGATTYTFSTTTGEMSINGVGSGTPMAAVIFRTIWDGGGTDTYDLSNFTTDLMIDLAPGGFSNFDVGGTALLAMLNTAAGFEEYASGHLYNALTYMGSLDSLIENAVGGTGADEILGNEAANSLSGLGGSDTLYGGSGKDSLYGDIGVDSLYGGDDKDKLFGGDGNDILFGDGADDRLFGGDSNDSLAGGDGADKLVGGLGDDMLDGGTGIDVFVYNASIYQGTDTITGFVNGSELIEISNAMIGDLTISKDRANTYVLFNSSGTLIILKNEQDLINAADFDFV